MRGLRVDTFKIFNNRRDHRLGCRPSFKHNRSLAARPEMDDGGETEFYQWVMDGPTPARPLPAVSGNGYPRCRARRSVTCPPSPNLKQVIPYGGHRPLG